MSLISFFNSQDLSLKLPLKISFSSFVKVYLGEINSTNFFEVVFFEPLEEQNEDISLV